MPIFDPAALQAQAAQVQQADPQPQTSSSEGIGLGPYAALAGGQLADILSTLYAKQHGAQETNPVLGNFGPKDIALKAGMSLPMILLMRHLANTGHPTAAKWLGYGSGAGLGAVAAHNLTQVK